MGISSPKTVPPPITTMETEQVKDLEMATVLVTEALENSIPTAKATAIPTATTQDLTPGLAPTTDPIIA